MFVIALHSFAILACGGDGWSALMMPQPSEKKVLPADIAGVYEYSLSAPVKVELTASGQFTVTGSSEWRGYGTWRLNSDNTISLDYASQERYAHQV